MEIVGKSYNLKSSKEIRYSYNPNTSGMVGAGGFKVSKKNKDNNN